MKNLNSIQIIYALCALCVCNLILSPVVQRTFGEIDPVEQLASEGALLVIILDSISGPLDMTGDSADSTEDFDFLTSKTTEVYPDYPIRVFTHKIPTQAPLLLHPHIELFSPPPERIS